MDIYKRASKKGLRVQTKAGSVSVEKLWTLPIDSLDELAVSLSEKLDNSSKKSFLEKKTTTQTEDKLKFDIVLDILETKVSDADRAARAAETKAKKQKLMELISRKKDEELGSKSVAELEAELDAL